MRRAEGEPVDPVREVVVLRPHEGRQVGVAAHQRHGLARGHVEVARHLVQVQGAVDAAGVVRLVRFRPSIDFEREKEMLTVRAQTFLQMIHIIFIFPVAQ